MILVLPVVLKPSGKMDLSTGVVARPFPEGTGTGVDDDTAVGAMSIVQSAVRFCRATDVSFNLYAMSMKD